MAGSGPKLNVRVLAAGGTPGDHTARPRHLHRSLVDDTENVEWVTFVNSTGEPWFFRNQEVRFATHVTSQRPDVSPFIHISAPLQRQIARYQENGWLPKPNPTRV